MDSIQKNSKNETVRFLLGFFGMISLGFVFLVAVGFYQIQYGGGDDVTSSAAISRQ